MPFLTGDDGDVEDGVDKDVEEDVGDDAVDSGLVFNKNFFSSSNS